MVAVTLSTVGCRSSDVGRAVVEVVGRGSFVGGRELPVVVQTIVNVPGDRVGAAARGRDAAEIPGRLSREALEHRGRGLLNLVAMVSRCLEDETAPDAREQWREELRQANEKLEVLYRCGLSPTFLSGPSSATRAP